MNMKLKHIVDSTVIVALVIMTGLYFKDLNKKLDTADEYMIIGGIAISDGFSWEDLNVIYDRKVYQPFDASWEVRIYQVGDPETPACVGSGTNHYDPSLIIRNVTLSWYVGTFCDLQPGARYIARTEWILDNGISIRNTSNIFKIYENYEDSSSPQPNRF